MIFPFRKAHLDYILQETDTTAEQLLNWFEDALKIHRELYKSGRPHIMWAYPCTKMPYRYIYSFENTKESCTEGKRKNVFMNSFGPSIYHIWNKAVTNDHYALLLIQKFKKMFKLVPTESKWNKFKIFK